MAVENHKVDFDGTQDYVDVVWDNDHPSCVILGSVTVTDGSGGIVPWLTNRVDGGARLNVSGRFTGNIDLTVVDI